MLNKKSSGLYIFEVKGSLLNGSPDGNGSPRQLSDSTGWATDVSLKRKIRDMFEDHNSPIVNEICENLKTDLERCHILESFNKGYEDITPLEAAHKALELSNKNPNDFLNRYLDVRLFGTTFLANLNKNEETPDDSDEENEEGKKKSNKKKKQPKEKGEVGMVRTGVVTISDAFSISPISVSEETISKKAPMQAKRLDAEQGTLAPGAHKRIEHGIYYFTIGVNPHYAHKTLTTKEDIEIMKYVLPYIFSATSSASRPIGSIRPIHIFWMEHKNSLGSFNEIEAFNRLLPRRKTNLKVPSTSIEEYEFPQTVEGVDVVDLLKF